MRPTLRPRRRARHVPLGLVFASLFASLLASSHAEAPVKDVIDDQFDDRDGARIGRSTSAGAAQGVGSPHGDAPTHRRLSEEAPLPPVPLPEACLSADSEYDAVLFSHLRKAGGTTVTNALNKAASTYTLPFFGIEGRALNRGAVCEALRSAGLRSVAHVTALREPLARAISSYHFDTYQERVNHGVPLGVPQPSLSEWMDAVTAKRCKEAKKGILWQEFDNYYVRRFAHLESKGCERDPGMLTITEAHYKEAELVLNMSAAVLVTEALEDGAGLLGRALGISGIGLQPHLPNGERRNTTQAAHAAHRTQGLDPAVLARLQAANVFDSRLYAHAESLFRAGQNNATRPVAAGEEHFCSVRGPARPLGKPPRLMAMLVRRGQNLPLCSCHVAGWQRDPEKPTTECRVVAGT